MAREVKGRQEAERRRDEMVPGEQEERVVRSAKEKVEVVEEEQEQEQAKEGEVLVKGRGKD